MRSDLYYFNPRPPWGGRHRLLFLAGSFLISIHALRGEGDWSKPKSNQIRSNFNPRPPWGGRLLLPALRRENGKISIHALRGEGDHRRENRQRCFELFQSTPSVGRATISGTVGAITKMNFNPRPPWGGRPRQGDSLSGRLAFQSTPSVGRATRRYNLTHLSRGQFQSTPSVGRATYTLE